MNDTPPKFRIWAQGGTDHIVESMQARNLELGQCLAYFTRLWNERVNTDKPAYDPYFSNNDPTNGKGFESAVAYAIADKLGFTKDQVKWTVVPFNCAVTNSVAGCCAGAAPTATTSTASGKG